jgi:cell division protein FtsX
VDGIKSEVDRQRRTGRVALVAALVIGLLMGIFAMFVVWLYPVSTPEVGLELISKIQSAIEPYKQYLLLPIAGCAIFLGLIFGREERRVF